jgi:hypothetical protein
MDEEPRRLWTVIPAGQQSGGGWVDDTLRERAAESGLAAKVPLAANFPRQRIEVVSGSEPGQRLNALYYARGWTDGLPVVAPTLERVRAMLRFSVHRPEHSLGEVDPLKGVATVEKVAANAVMAGCLPEYFPIVLAAVDALLDPTFNMRGVQTTDENVTPLVVVNGPIARALDVNGRYGALGPGWRANASIGRALRLVMNNIGGGWPGAVSFAGLGQPGRYTLCLAENEAESPWEPLHTEAGLPREADAVTVMRAETAINVTGGLAEVASVMGSAASAFSVLWSGHSTVILSPSLAASLAKDGLTKDAVREWLFEHGRWPADEWRASWLYRTVGGPERWPDWVRVAAEQGGEVPVVRSPSDLVLIVAGGSIPIPQHVYCPSWGFPPARITREVRLPADWVERAAESAAVERERCNPV